MLYAIKSDTRLNSQANRILIERSGSVLRWPMRNMIARWRARQITGSPAAITKATRGKMVDQIFSVFLGEVPRDDAIPYVADFFLQLENVRWTLVAGVVNGSFVMSVRNLGYTRNAGDFVRRYFVDIGSAGGHRAMAKAVVPLDAFQSRFGLIDDNMGVDVGALAGVPARSAEDKKKGTRRQPLLGNLKGTSSQPRPAHELPVPSSSHGPSTRPD